MPTLSARRFVRLIEYSQIEGPLIRHAVSHDVGRLVRREDDANTRIGYRQKLLYLSAVRSHIKVEFRWEYDQFVRAFTDSGI